MDRLKSIAVLFFLWKKRKVPNENIQPQFTDEYERIYVYPIRELYS